MNVNNSKKRIGKDVALNIVANAIPILVLQVLVQPYIANSIGSELNGQFMTVLALIHLLIVLTSGSLSASRLLLYKQYRKEGIEGDFNIYLIILSIFNFVVVFGGCILYDFDLSIADISCISILAVIWLIKDYIIVQYRQNLDYKNILVNNMVLSGGFVLGLFFFKYFPHWYIVFVSGYILALLHALLTTNLIKEKPHRTKLFITLYWVFSKLFIAHVLSVIVLNFDRLVLYPLVGGVMISIFYSASIVSKMLSMVSVPISNVLLSYLVKMDSLSRKKIKLVCAISLGFGVVMYLVCIFISPFVLDLLYPKWSEESMVYVPITAAFTSFELIVTLLNPFVLRFCNVSYQIVLQAVYLLLYSLLGMGLFYRYGLMGFAIGAMIAILCKVLCTYLIMYKKILSIN